MPNPPIFEVEKAKSSVKIGIGVKLRRRKKNSSVFYMENFIKLIKPYKALKAHPKSIFSLVRLTNITWLLWNKMILLDFAIDLRCRFKFENDEFPFIFRR